jgi:hypothetical protein
MTWRPLSISPYNKAYVDLKGCLTSETQLLLRKGRRLTQQTLDSCQLR